MYWEKLFVKICRMITKRAPAEGEIRCESTLLSNKTIINARYHEGVFFVFLSMALVKYNEGACLNNTEHVGETNSN